jgi:hypothetical protein
LGIGNSHSARAIEPDTQQPQQQLSIVQLQETRFLLLPALSTPNAACKVMNSVPGGNNDFSARGYRKIRSGVQWAA